MTKKVRHLEHHPDEWLVGVAGLTPEQNGIYRTICDLIASSGGPIPIHDERLFRIVKAKPNRIKRVINELLAGHKLTINGSLVGNRRVIDELERAKKRIIDGEQGAAKRWKNNDLGDALPNARARKPETINQKPEAREHRCATPDGALSSRQPTTTPPTPDEINHVHNLVNGAIRRIPQSDTPDPTPEQRNQLIAQWNKELGIEH